MNERKRPPENQDLRQCIECGEAISARRLEAVPETLRCLRCQESFDQAQELNLDAA
jgi:RNA polymerase-binding transcription factor DksA